MKTHANQPRRRSLRGFTLIELMIAVVIIAILAAVAAFGYGSYTKRAKTSQAKAFISAIAAHQAGRTTYAGATSLAYCPASIGARATNWDASCQTNMWATLGIETPRQTYFQYAVVAGGAADSCTTMTSNATLCGTWTTGDRWWIAVARGDLDGNGVFSTFITSYSLGGEIIEIDPYE